MLKGVFFAYWRSAVDGALLPLNDLPSRNFTNDAAKRPARDMQLYRQAIYANCVRRGVSPSAGFGEREGSFNSS